MQEANRAEKEGDKTDRGTFTAAPRLCQQHGTLYNLDLRGFKADFESAFFLLSPSVRNKTCLVLRNFADQVRIHVSFFGRQPCCYNCCELAGGWQSDERGIQSVTQPVLWVWGGGASSPPRLEQVKVGYRLRCPLKESDADFLKDEGDKQTLSWAPRAVTSSIHRLCADFVVVVELWPQFLFISLKLPVEQQKLF